MLIIVVGEMGECRNDMSRCLTLGTFARSLLYHDQQHFRTVGANMWLWMVPGTRVSIVRTASQRPWDPRWFADGEHCEIACRVSHINVSSALMLETRTCCSLAAAVAWEPINEAICRRFIMAGDGRRARRASGLEILETHRCLRCLSAISPIPPKHCDFISSEISIKWQTVSLAVPDALLHSLATRLANKHGRHDCSRPARGRSVRLMSNSDQQATKAKAARGQSPSIG